MVKVDSSPPAQPHNNHHAVVRNRVAKAGNRKATVNKPPTPRFSLKALAARIRDTMLCDRSISVIDSVTPKKIMPAPEVKEAPKKDAPTQHPPAHDNNKQPKPRPLPQLPVETDSGIASDKLTQETASVLTERDDTNDSGCFLKAGETAKNDRQMLDEIAQNPLRYNMQYLRMENVATYPAREALNELEELEDPIKVHSDVANFLHTCRTDSQWRDNPLDLTMEVFKKLQSIINESSMSLQEKTNLDKKLAIAARWVLKQQLPKLSAEQAWQRLDTYETILLANTHNEKMQLFAKALANISTHFSLDKDPWEFQFDRLKKGHGTSMAFLHLAEQCDNDQVKSLALKSFLNGKIRLLNKLHEVNKRYDVLDDGSMDDQPFSGNEPLAEMLKLSRQENRLRRRLGAWDRQALNAAQAVLKNV